MLAGSGWGETYSKVLPAIETLTSAMCEMGRPETPPSPKLSSHTGEQAINKLYGHMHRTMEVADTRALTAMLTDDFHLAHMAGAMTSTVRSGSRALRRAGCFKHHLKMNNTIYVCFGLS